MDRLQIALDRARDEREDARVPAKAVATSKANQSNDAAIVPEASSPEEASVAIPTIETRPDSMVAKEWLSKGADRPVSAAYKMLRTRVLQRMREHGWSTVAVVSPMPNDGKTFTAINLAIAIASDTTHSTLLVDFDLRKPSVSRRFGFEPEYGVDDCLTGKVGVAAALVTPSGFKKLALLPARESHSNSSELITSERAVQLVKEIKNRYSNRIVVFDLPPILVADDAMAFAPLVDCALLVVGAGRTRQEELVRSLDVLHKVPILGTVLNGSRSEYSPGYVY
jgi:protein-tyrosine kinase